MPEEFKAEGSMFCGLGANQKAIRLDKRSWLGIHSAIMPVWLPFAATQVVPVAED